MIENAFLSKVSQNCVNEQVSNHHTVTDDILEYPWGGSTDASKYVSSIGVQSVQAHVRVKNKIFGHKLFPPILIFDNQGGTSDDSAAQA